MWFPKALILTLALVGPIIPIAGTGSAADFVLISESDTIPDDLYAAGNVVDVRGTIDGDLTATASQRVVVSGTVKGDVIAIAPSVEITGTVDGSVRAIADRVALAGNIAEDVVVTARDTSISGEVGRDVLAFVYSVDLSGSTTKNFKSFAVGVVEIAGHVGRDLEVNSRRLDVLSTGSVAGDVRYRGEANISGNAELSGSPIQLGKTPIPLRVRALALAGVVVACLIVLLAGLALFWLAPQTTEAASRAIKNWVWAVIIGVATIVLPIAVIIGVIAAMGAASPDLFGVAILATSPILVLYIGLVAFMLVLGFVPMASLVGRLLTRDRISTVGGFVLGVLVIAALSQLPVVGVPIVVVAWLMGIGGWMLGARTIRLRSVA